MEVGTVVKKTINLPWSDASIVVNSRTITMMVIASALLLGLGVLGGRLVRVRPSRTQSFVELIIGGFYNLVEETLGESARKYFPFITSVFLFVLVCNLLGVIPGFMSPTEDLNVCIALASVVFVVAHGSGIKKKGLKGYFQGYCQPFFVMLPLNIIGEMGQTLSHCFRLFGNIFGGGIIFALIPYVTFKIMASLGLPDISETVAFSEMSTGGIVHYLLFGGPLVAVLYAVAYAFFGLFAGTVQALVFTMLALTYISLQVEE